MSEQGVYLRRSARVLLLDSTERILLLRFYHDPANPTDGTFWLTPGGGVDRGETPAEAAVREIREEIGLDIGPEDLGGPVAHTAGFAAVSWGQGVFRDDFFYVRLDSHDVDTSGFTEFERTQYAGHRWWPVSELASTSETIYPLELASLVTDLLAGSIPDRPVALPWHH